MPPFTPPDGYPRIRVVKSFHELTTTPFEGGVNALCWPRTLEGDFAEVVAQLGAGEGMATLDESRLKSLRLGAGGKAAVDILLEDLRLLRELGLEPGLDCIRGYARDEADAIVPTDVYSFHADRATEETDTYLCTYHGPASEGLRNDEARARVDIPETRAALLRVSGRKDDADFNRYLAEHSYDLHYAPLPKARPFSFGRGNLWRVAVDYPGSPVPPFIHRAPANDPGQPRLLLIS